MTMEILVYICKFKVIQILSSWKWMLNVSFFLVYICQQTWSLFFPCRLWSKVLFVVLKVQLLNIGSGSYHNLYISRPLSKSHHLKLVMCFPIGEYEITNIGNGPALGQFSQKPKDIEASSNFSWNSQYFSIIKISILIQQPKDKLIISIIILKVIAFKTKQIQLQILLEDLWCLLHHVSHLLDTQRSFFNEMNDKEKYIAESEGIREVVK